MVSNVDEDDEELSGSDADEGFDEDMEALRKACILTGTDPNTLQTSASAAADADTGKYMSGGGAVSDSDEDDLELVRGIQRRFSACTHTEAPLFLKPLSTLPPALSDDDEDDFETLRAIQKRFAGYDQDSMKNRRSSHMNKLEQVHATNITLEEETANNLVVDRTNVSAVFLDSLDVYNTSQNSETINDAVPRGSPSGLIEWHQPDTDNLAIIPPSGSGFPKFAQMFVDAIKKNRACQKFLRSKLLQIEARLEENKTLKQRVKTLKDFQVSCKKRTGRALSQKKDSRVQLISVVKPRADSKVNGKKVSPLNYGPNENSHVAIYRTVLKKFPISLNREKWSDEESENLAKGIKQQFQELLLQKSVDLISDDGSSGRSNGFDSIIASIRDLDITPENIRSFLPKVNWERLASMYIRRHSGAECEARWLNWEDPLINHNPWTNKEDKNLLKNIQQRGISDWIDIAVLLGTNRTPFQCLARYQRSLNASIMKRDWTEDEDDKLRAAVEAFGESNWQTVASTLEGRTGTQCSNRWIKSLHPARQKVGRWSLDEDKRLKIAVMLFGAKTWKKLAQFVPGRTHVQCRERWFNSLDPCLTRAKWTEEEDSRLIAAAVEHNCCWSKVAECVHPRTDNQCWRRWRDLNPDKVPLLLEAKKIKRTALRSNFVDQESERPALGPNDFIPLALTNGISESDNRNPSRKQKRKSRASRSKAKEKVSRTKRSTRQAKICSGEVPFINSSKVENYSEDGSISKKRVTKPHAKKSSSEPTQDARRNGQVILSDWWTKKKRSFGRQKRKFRERPEAASREDAILKKERAMKPYLKNKRTDPTKDHLSACAASELLIMTTGGKKARKFGKNRAAKIRKASKSSQRTRKCVKLTDENSRMIKSDEVVSSGENDAISDENKTLSLPHLEQRKRLSVSTTSKITNVNELEATSDAAVRKKNGRKLFSKSKYNRLMQELLERSDSSEFETLGNNDASLKKRRINKRSLKTCTASSNSFTRTENEVEPFSGNDDTKQRKSSKPSSSSKCIEPPKESKSLPLLPASLEIRRADDEYITTLHREKRAPRRKCFKQSRKHQDYASSFLEVTQSRSKQSEITKLVEGFQNGLSENDNSKASGMCKQARLKRPRTREKTCSNHRSEEEEDDTTLALFVKNERKKRRLKLSRMGNDAPCPGSMNRSESLYDENFCNGGSNDGLSSQAVHSSHLEDPPCIAVGGIDREKSHSVTGRVSPFHESLKEAFYEGIDDPIDTFFLPPGFENPVYGFAS
ncbi:uncharacterized protein LOC130750003 isoform X1 [Actinidia eriantha]|uniref:uncharacterized protein LOC130750003 isoform X1 n=2 Tax=Actinidia eriantha TaxID=165200 RepID=UPI00258CD154|nr:uncharacterized protein LOC130750003 isoform X1 [Actinidia eriantha]